MASFGGIWHFDHAEQIDFDAYIEENKADFMPDDWRPPRCESSYG
jgi:hypothetical protein